MTENEHPAERRVSRRTVLKAAGIGGGTVLALGAIGVGARAGTNGGWDTGQGAPYALWHDWQDAPGLLRLVAAGALAANPHNLQPWTFEVTDTTIDLYDDPGRAMPLNDADGRERIAGYGCALQNIVLAARAERLDPRITAWPDQDPRHIAHIEVVTGSAPGSRDRDLAAAIATRHSNRGPYTDRDLDRATLTALQEGAPDGAELVWVTDRAAMARIADQYLAATEAIIGDREMSAESFAWFRNDRADIDRHRDGLTLDCQGLDPFTLFMAKVLPAQSRTSSDSFWLKATRDTHTATARAYGIIRVSDTGDRDARLAGGRLLQHVHLAATAAGLGLHHMNQVTECIARAAATGNPDGFSDPWAEATGVPAGQALLAFRIGHPERTPNPSPRRELAEFARTA